MRNKYVGEDIRQRLHQTIIRYRQQPFFCSVDGTIINLLDLVTMKVMHRVLHDDPEIDISSLDLGYMNVTNPAPVAIHMARVGGRRYRQGVDPKSLSYDVLLPSSEKFHFNPDLIFCQGFVDAYNGKFPSVKEAIGMVAKTHRSVAISNDVAILREKDIIKVFVKNEEVGWMKAGGSIVNLPPSETSWINRYFLERFDGWKIEEGVGAK